MQIGTAISAAAEHGRTSPGMHAALTLLDMLLMTATASGLINVSAAAGSLAISMRQQLQQAGLLQQLAGVMVALTADMRSEAAALEGMDWDALQTVADSTVHSGASCVRFEVLAHIYPDLSALWFSEGQTMPANSISWLCDPSGHAEAAMELCTAALQHTSSVLQHVLPAVQQRAPQRADVLLRALQRRVAAVMMLGHNLAVPMLSAAFNLPPESNEPALARQQQHMLLLLLSQDCLPFVASLLVLNTFTVTTCSKEATSGIYRQGGSSAACSNSSSSSRGNSRGSGINSSSSSSSSSSVGRDSGSSGTQWGQPLRQQPGADAASSSSVRANGDDTPTPCQLQLMQLLRFDPQLASLVESMQLSRSQAVSQLSSALAAYAACHNVLHDHEPFKWQLGWLLPSVLLPCASKLLLLPAASASHDAPQQEQGQEQGQEQKRAAGVLHDLLNLSWRIRIPHNNHLLAGGQADDLSAAASGEALGGVLQLADQLLLQQQPQAELQGQAVAAGAAAGALGHNPAASSSSSSSSSIGQPLIRHTAQSRAKQADLILKLLLVSVTCLYKSSLNSSSVSSQGEASSGHTAAASGLSAVPLLAERLVDVCTAMEAGLRAASASFRMQIDSSDSQELMDHCLRGLSFGLDDFHIVESSRAPLVLHLGICGRESLVNQLRQFHSTLSTVQKLAHAGSVFWGQHVPNHCCMAAAHAAIALLQASLAAGGSGSAAPATADEQAYSTPATVAQLPEVGCLPSLVILGRCCLTWAEQLRQQSPELLQASGVAVPEHQLQHQQTSPLQQQQKPPQQQQQPPQPQQPQPQQQQQGGGQPQYCAAHVCIPGWWVRQAGFRPPPCGLNMLGATVSAWVDGVTSPAALAALAAAAGGDLQQFRQRLKALSATHSALQEGISGDALAALVWQLQETGVMLSSVAVPHFCNNPACVNLSGPTEVQLVSGRSCICAGCRVARYCGRGCQRQAWPRHKAVCKALAATAATEV